MSSRQAGLGIRCVVAKQNLLCDTCASGLCELCGVEGRWRREQQKRPQSQRYVVRVFWELRVHNGLPNVLRVRKCCKHCDALEYEILNSASKLTMQLMQAALRQASGLMAKGGEIDLEKVFWQVLVMEKESELGTSWEECPVCTGVHSVHRVCLLTMEKNG